MMAEGGLTCTIRPVILGVSKPRRRASEARALDYIIYVLSSMPLSTLLILLDSLDISSFDHS